MAYRYATGRPPPKIKSVRDVRSVLREHLREEGKTIENDLSHWWNVKPHSAHRILYAGRRLTPQHVEAAIEGLKLDEFDAYELRVLGAREAGWNVKLEKL